MFDIVLEDEKDIQSRVEFYEILIKALLVKVNFSVDFKTNVVLFPNDIIRAESLDLIMFREGHNDSVVLSLSNQTARIAELAQIMKNRFDSVPTPEDLKAAYKLAFGVTL